MKKMTMDSSHQSQQQAKPRKHSTISMFSSASSPLSSMMLQIDPRLIPKSLFKFYKTDDERMAMLERFRQEGIDPKKLNDSKKLLHVWRWLVDAEINCQSLRHQLEKMHIQHEQELQEVETYVGHVWKLSMERLASLQEENRFLHSKLLHRNSQMMIGSELDGTYHDLNNNHENDRNFNGDGDDDNFHNFSREYFYGNSKLPGKPLVNLKNFNRLATYHTRSDHNHLVPHSLSTLSFSPVSSCHSSNIINTTTIHDVATTNNTNLAGAKRTMPMMVRRSLSCLDFLSNNLIDDNNDDDDNKKTLQSNCNGCQKMKCQLSKFQKQFKDIYQKLNTLEEQNSVLKKLNRCIEIENENFAFKLSESESQSNQLEQHILILEQELKNQRIPRTSCSLPSQSYSNQMELSSPQSSLVIIQEQQKLIEELNKKVKRLEEILDTKRLELEEAESKLFKKQPSSNFPSSSLWFRKSDPNNNHHSVTNQKLTSDYYGSSDGFEEIKLS